MKFRRLTRREVLLGGVTGSALGVVSYMTISPSWISTTRRSLNIFQTAGRPVRLVHLSDLHADETPLSVISDAVRIVESANPDLIALTGDYITSVLSYQREYLDLLSRLSRIAPTYAVLGNHDGGEWARGAGGYWDSNFVRRILSRARIEVLHNRRERLAIGERRLDLVGIGDLWSGEFEPRKAFGQVQSAVPTVVLSHNPDSKSEIAEARWDLLLSGHTHGGQLVVPITGERPFAPVKDKRYIAGMIPWQDRMVHVTTGVGTIMGMRFNCPPEVVVIDLI